MRMLDKEKLKQLQLIGLVLGVLVVLGLVFVIGLSSFRSKEKTPKSSQKTHQVTKKRGSELTQSYVRDFLIAYMTKKELGENRNRYLPYMTEGAYQQEITQEDDPSVTAYKGYVVDSRLREATIYIDQEHHVALAQITYSQTELEKKGDYHKAQTGVLVNMTLEIHYLKQDKKYLVNHIQQIEINDQLSDAQKARLPQLNLPYKNTIEGETTP